MNVNPITIFHSAAIAKNSPVLIKQAKINALIDLAKGGNARICLHAAPDDPYHDMVVLERVGFYFPPHRHATKAETLHIIQGELAVFAFDNDGKVTFSVALGRDGALIARIPINQYHFTSPLTETVIYHESKPGPFLGEDDREFAPWAPGRNDPHDTYLERLRETERI